jgi:hypothetical protein
MLGVADKVTVGLMILVTVFVDVMHEVGVTLVVTVEVGRPL